MSEAGRTAGVKVLAGVALALLFVVVPARPAHACSCGEPDAATAITVDITASRVETRPDDGNDFWAVVDLRGERTTVVGALPVLLAGVEIETVPVLSSVIADPSAAATDSCNTPRAPTAGTDLRVTGHASQDDGELVIWSGPCSGSFEVTSAAPVAVVDPVPDANSTMTTVLVGAGVVAVAGLVAVSLERRRRATR